ncbi:MAG: glycosyltransferase family 39 protein [Anaerolineae bacterium]|jgi:hypothetical protein
MDKTETRRIEAGPLLGWRWGTLAVLLALMLVALVLRWRYIQEISLSVDEFNTIFAARQVLVRGVPSFPSGNLYPHGFVFTYLVVPFVLGEFSETLARLPGLLVSLATLPVAFRVGRKLFDDRVALIAVAALAVDPDAIVWGGRARMYGLLQLLTILVIYFYYRGLSEDRAGYRYLALGLVVVTIFTHAEAMLLLPALVVVTLLNRSWRQLARRDIILPFVLAGVGAVVFYLMSRFGQPGHLETLQESRPYLDVTTDVLSGPQVFAPVLFALHRLPFTLLTIGGVILLFRPRFDRGAPLTHLYVVFGTILLPLLILAGATWRNERYLFLLLPLLYFIAGAVTVRLLDRIGVLRRTLAWQPVLLASVVALYIGLTGSYLAYQPEIGYDRAFRTLRDEFQPSDDDVIVTVSPAGCAVYDAACDYFAMQRGYEEFVVSRPSDGAVADLWTATRLLTDTAEFVDLLEAGPPVWFLSDAWRFQTRYEAEFIQTVLDRMDLVYNEGGVLIYRSTEGAPPSPPEYERPRYAEFGRALALVGFGLSSLSFQAGDEVEVQLNWQALEEAGVGYTAFLHLLAPGEVGVAGRDGPVLDGRYQPDLWPPEKVLVDRHRVVLPADLAPGRYRLDLGLYPTGEPEALLAVGPPPDMGGPQPAGDDDRLPLVTLTVGDGVQPPPGTTPAQLDFGQRLRLAGYDLVRGSEDEELGLQLYWQGLAAMERDYTVFAHLLDAEAEIVAQDDSPPGDPFFPTATWLPGDVVADSRKLVLPENAPLGDYVISVGLYYQPTGERLPVTDGQGESLGDAFDLGPITFGAEAR